MTSGTGQGAWSMEHGNFCFPCSQLPAPCPMGRVAHVPGLQRQGSRELGTWSRSAFYVLLRASFPLLPAPCSVPSSRRRLGGVGELDASIRNDVQLAAIGMCRAPRLDDEHLPVHLLAVLDKTESNT